MRGPFLLFLTGELLRKGRAPSGHRASLGRVRKETVGDGSPRSKSSCFTGVLVFVADSL